MERKKNPKVEMVVIFIPDLSDLINLIKRVKTTRDLGVVNLGSCATFATLAYACR